MHIPIIVCVVSLALLVVLSPSSLLRWDIYQAPVDVSPRLTLRPLIDAFPRQRLAFPDANPPLQYFHPYYMKCPPQSNLPFISVCTCICISYCIIMYIHLERTCPTRKSGFRLPSLIIRVHPRQCGIHPKIDMAAINVILYKYGPA